MCVSVGACERVCVCRAALRNTAATAAPQVAEGDGVPLGPDALRPHQHPDVSAGVALDARRLPALHPPRSPAGLCGAARGGGAPL